MRLHELTREQLRSLPIDEEYDRLVAEALEPLEPETRTYREIGNLQPQYSVVSISSGLGWWRIEFGYTDIERSGLLDEVAEWEPVYCQGDGLGLDEQEIGILGCGLWTALVKMNRFPSLHSGLDDAERLRYWVNLYNPSLLDPCEEDTMVAALSRALLIAKWEELQK